MGGDLRWWQLNENGPTVRECNTAESQSNNEETRDTAPDRRNAPGGSYTFTQN